MKLGKASWLILTAGVLIITFAGLGVARFQQLDERDQLSGELAVAQHRLGKFQLKQLASQKLALEQQLAGAIAQLEAVRNEIIQPLESITVTDSLFEIAQACGVEITDIISSDLDDGELEGIPSSVINLSIRVEGYVLNLIDFTVKLNNDFTAGVVTSVKMNTAQEVEEETEGEQAEGEIEEEEAEMPSASIQLVIYGYQGE